MEKIERGIKIVLFPLSNNKMLLVSNTFVNASFIQVPGWEIWSVLGILNSRKLRQSFYASFSNTLLALFD